MNPTNVLHFSTADNQGGSARCAYRIHTGLRERGLTSRMIVKYKVTDDPDVCHPTDNPLMKGADKVFGRIQTALSLPYLFYPSTPLLRNHDWVRNADIVQLFNLHGNYFAHPFVRYVAARKPIVWWLSDQWPFTGHCGYSYDCERWRTGCGRCPLLEEYPPLRHDTSAINWKIKKAAFKNANITVVAPSRWLARISSESPILGDYKTHYIPNGIDTNHFRPVEKQDARRALGIATTAPVILILDPGPGGERKGTHLLKEFSERVSLGAKEKPHYLLFGRGAEAWKGDNVTAVGEVDIPKLPTVYSAADLFVFPTLADNLPNVAVESMSCGTPVLSFPVGGMPDIVLPGRTGTLVSNQTAEALAAGAVSTIADRGALAVMGRQARQLIENEFNQKLEIDRFVDLYKDLRR